MLPWQALEEARNLVSSGWCQGVGASDREGRPVEPWDARACSWSLPGAVLAVAERTGVDSRFLAQVGLSALALAIVGRVGELQDWNDAPERTVAEVLSVFEAACAMLPRPVRRQVAAQTAPGGTVAPERGAGPAPVVALHRLGLRRPVRAAGQSCARPLTTRAVAAEGDLAGRLVRGVLRWRGAFA